MKRLRTERLEGDNVNGSNMTMGSVRKNGKEDRCVQNKMLVGKFSNTMTTNPALGLLVLRHTSPVNFTSQTNPPFTNV